jgi:hypothetical protein
MRPATVSCVVDAPRERVFDYLADLANHGAITDHFAKDYRLERLESRGIGAAARFRVASSLARLPLLSPLASIWTEVVITEAEPPYRLLLEGSAGRAGRVGVRTEFRLTLHDANMTCVELTFSSAPATRADSLREALGGRPWLKAQFRRALRRLRAVIEEGDPSVGRVRVAPG